MLEHSWAENFAEDLRLRLQAGGGAVVTWFNHYSAQKSLPAGLAMSAFSHIGIDGIFLRGLLGEKGLPRTSADLVLPVLLKKLPTASRVLLVGSTSAAAARAAAVVAAYPNQLQVTSLDGFDGLPKIPDLVKMIHDERVDVLVLGLGSPLQDTYAVGVSAHAGRRHLILTCGGWIDQVSNPAYYPEYAYRLRLNWLFRLVGEPSRLWKRYTLEAVRGLSKRKEIQHWLLHEGRSAVEAAREACSPR